MKRYSLFVADIAISADGAAVPYEIYIDPNDINTSVGSGSINAFDKQEWSLPGFDLNSEATLYRFTVSSKEKPYLDFEISFDADQEQTFLIDKGFGGVSYSEDGRGTLSSQIREKTEAEILILGKAPEFTYEILTDEREQAEESRYQLEIIQDPVDPREYLRAVLREEIRKDTAAAISDPQLFNLFLHKLWEHRLNNSYSTLYEGFSGFYEDRIFTLVYQVEFPPYSTRSVSVGYLTEGTMDRRETVSPKYSYTYLLSPARNWADFGSLDVEVITPREAPYMIENSLGLSKDGENRYNARFDGLPDSELTFTLYEKKAITFIDKTEKTISRASYLLFFLWPVFIIFLAVIAVPVVRAIIRRTRRGPDR